MTSLDWKDVSVARTRQNSAEPWIASTCFLAALIVGFFLGRIY